MIIPRDLTPEQRASIAAMYRFLASRIVWAGGVYDPRADLLLQARELERGAPVHVHHGGKA